MSRKSKLNETLKHDLNRVQTLGMHIGGFDDLSSTKAALYILERARLELADVLDNLHRQVQKSEAAADPQD